MDDNSDRQTDITSHSFKNLQVQSPNMVILHHFDKKFAFTPIKSNYISTKETYPYYVTHLGGRVQNRFSSDFRHVVDIFQGNLASFLSPLSVNSLRTNQRGRESLVIYYDRSPNRKRRLVKFKEMGRGSFSLDTFPTVMIKNVDEIMLLSSQLSFRCQGVSKIYIYILIFYKIHLFLNKKKQ